jgi:L-threonylcarbamoyladenylate synthase
MDANEAVVVLNDGGVVALPTDTVYGIGASLGFPDAVAALFTLKRRPRTVALPVLVSSVEQIESLGVEWDERARKLSDAFWPGALTIVVEAPSHLAELVGGTNSTVGFRCPDDELLLGVLERCGPLALTSANGHGEVPCESAAQVREAFDGEHGLDGVLDGGERSGRVSTVVDLSGGTYRFVRDGAITQSALLSVLG